MAVKIIVVPEQIVFPVFAEMVIVGTTVPVPLRDVTANLGELLEHPFIVTATEYVPEKLVVYVEPVEPSCQR